MIGGIYFGQTYFGGTGEVIASYFSVFVNNINSTGQFDLDAAVSRELDLNSEVLRTLDLSQS
jgi:hypothetical protein